jgi:prepilin-type N-terminal cleavage/methylation domain-containing protein
MRTTRSRQRGFTLIELLVVIAIITVLMALSLGAVMFFTRGVGQTKATQATLRNAKTRMDTQWKAVLDHAQKESIEGKIGATGLQQIMTKVGATDPSDQRVRAMYVQLRLRQVFPQTFAEATTAPAGVAAMTPDPRYVTYLNGHGTSAANEAAICLFMALTTGEGNTGQSIDDFATAAVLDLDSGNGKTFKGLVDGWGQPLIFVRSNAPNSTPPGPSVITSAGMPNGGKPIDTLTSP